METAGLRGYIPKYEEQFLKKRYFKLRLENYASRVYLQQNGVIQGSVLALVTLFALKINSLARLIPKEARFISSLYVDDLQIGYRHSDLSIIKIELQQCLNRLHDWTKRNGFKISVTKTKILQFTTFPGLHNQPLLKIGGEIIPYTDCVRFLGLLWDPKLTWAKHVNKLRTDCSRLIGLLKTVTNQQWGSDQHCSLKIFQTYIRAKLDYGAPVYSSAAKTSLNILDGITRECIRIATGAFKTTPIESLFVLANEMRPQDRRDLLALRYFYKIKGNIGNPAYSAIVTLQYLTLFKNKGIAAPLNVRVQKMIEKYKLRKQYVKPEFSYKLLNITVPT